MTKEQQGAIIADVAARIGTKPELLDALINFETGGTYSTTISNTYSSAKGLIQLTDAPAREMGFADSLDAITQYPDFESQMYYVVLPYFKMQILRHGPLNTEQRLYMSVFYPAYMDNPPDTVFSQEIQDANPGIKKVQDYIDFVNSRVKQEARRIPSKALPIAIMALGAIGVYWLVTRKRR